MKQKRLLLVDDSEIDRGILKNIIQNDFDIVEVDNGYAALEIIFSGRPHVDGVLLDIFMPVLDGFNVLRLMQESKVENLPVILVTANATKPNVEKALLYKVTDFITKPFNASDIAERLRTLFSIEETKEVVIPKHTFSENDISETNTYISKLKKIFNEYLRNNNKDDEHYVNISALTEIMLTVCAAEDKTFEADSAHISMIAKAAYFIDMGFMVVPDALTTSKGRRTESDMAVYQTHTVAGAEMVWLNHSPSCRYFVKMCGEMCMHHHERNDGRGYPHKLAGSDNTIYAQIAGAANRFDRIFCKYMEINDFRFDFTLREMAVDSGEFSPFVLKLLDNSRIPILSYYKKKARKKEKYNEKKRSKKHEKEL